MDVNVLFSIVIPAYQVEKYIEECLMSIITQEFDNYEIVIVNDGSRDLTPEICEAYQKKYKHIKVVHQENKGLSEARNTGIRNSEGEYIIFVDGDDKIAPHSLKYLKEVLERDKFPEVIINRRITLLPDGNERECAYLFDKDKLKNMENAMVYRKLQELNECWLGVWIFVVKREFLYSKKLFFYPGIYHEDEEWVPRLMLNAKRIAYNNECLYVNRIGREGSITQRKSIKRIFDKLLIVDLLNCEKENERYGVSDRTVFEERIQKIVFGCLTDLSGYKEEEEYNKLLIAVREKLCYLKESKKIVHRVFYYIQRLVGITNTSKLILKIKGRMG